MAVEMELTAIDLFAGAGGATQGLRAAGFRVLAAVESDPVAASSFRSNHPRVRLEEDDIRNVDPSALRDNLGLRRGDITLLKACPPCQGYSSLGKTGVDDDRNDLVLEVWRFAREFLPRAMIVENVPGLARDERLGALTRKLRAVGYSVQNYIVDARSFGVPQRRRRLIVVAVKGGARTLPASLIELLPGWLKHKGMKTAGEALERSSRVDPDVDPLHRPRRISPDVHARLAALPIGGNRFDLPQRHRLRCHEELSRRRSATAAYSRVKSAEAAPTMTSRCTTPACGQFVHPTEARALTLREAATIQTFPIAYRFHGTVGQVERQIGNAVPVRMARGLGLCVLQLLDTRAE